MSVSKADNPARSVPYHTIRTDRGTTVVALYGELGLPAVPVLATVLTP